MSGALDAVARGGKGALARALSRLESGPAGWTDDASLALLDAAWAAPLGRVVGFTGPPGVGKSTLISALIARFRARGRRIGVIAVDPSSRASGGALLGDRTRFVVDPEDDGVFVRSMAARDRLGGLAAATFPAAALMRALYDVVIVETVGVGQSETEISGVADTVVFCAQPGAGDALQYMKAGVMEIPDLAVVTKSDLGAPAQRAAADLRGALSLAAQPAGRSPAPVALVSATTGEGLDALVDQLEATRSDRRAAQAVEWARGAVRERFGAVGLQHLGEFPPAGAPFEGVRDGFLRLERALTAGFAQQALSNPT